jgi:hypothetical protein
VLPASAQIGNERREAEVLLSPRATAGEVRKGEALALAAHWLDAAGCKRGSARRWLDSRVAQGYYHCAKAMRDEYGLIGS